MPSSTTKQDPPPPQAKTTAEPSTSEAAGTPAAEEDETMLGLFGLCGLCVACLCCVALSPLICCCAATNEAVHRAQGKRWDAKQHQWVVDNLQQEEQTLVGIPDDDGDILRKEETQSLAITEQEKIKN